MNIIKLFLLLTFGLWAEFKLDISKDIQVSQLESIVKNGWNDSNKTLNRLIVSEAERLMPEILEKIKKPFEKRNITKENRLPVPKIKLGREDYYFVGAYSKYLEKNNKTSQALKLNIQILEGLKNIEDTSMLSVIYSLVIEGIVRDGLSQLIATNKDLKKLKSTEFKYISTLFSLDTSDFFIAMERERDVLLNIDLYRETKEKYLNAQAGKNYKFLMQDVQKYIEQYQNNFYNKMFDAMKKETPEAMNIYKREMDKMIKEHMSYMNNIHFFVSSFWIKMKSLVGIEIKEFGYVSEYLARNLVYVATPKINEMYVDYLKHIEKNKLFLEKLKN